MEEDDQRLHELRVVDQMGGPQQLLPQLTQFQPADTPERLEAFLARLRAYPAFMAANTRHPARRDGLRADGAAHRRRADDRPDRADARRPDRRGDRPLDGQGRRPRRTARRSATPSGSTSTPRTCGSSRRCAATTSPRPARTRASGPRPTATRSTAPRCAAGRPSSSTRRRSTTSASRSSRRSRRSAARSPGPPGSATTPRPTGPRSTPIRRTPRGPRPSWSSGRPRTSSARWPPRRATSASCRKAGCDVRAGRGVQGARRALRVLLPAGPRRLATGDLLRQRLRPREPQVHQARDDHLPRGGARATTSRSRSRWRTRTSTAFRRLGSRMVGGAYVEGWGLYSERLADEMGLFRSEGERFGMLDAQAWRAARLVVDTGLHALRWPRQRSIDTLLGGRAVRDRRGHRDRPLHLLAGPGADLQDRPARDRAAARRALGAGRLALRPAGVPRRGPGPRLAAARHARPRAPELGGHPGLVRNEPQTVAA